MADSLAPTPALIAWPDWPEYGLVNDLLPTLEGWAAAGQRFALATLIEVQGSSPRPVGSEMAIAQDGQVAGYVSGGCVEAAVAQEALAVLADGRPRLLDYGAGSPVLDVQLSCGGRIRILVRAVDDAQRYLAQWRAARDARQPLTVITDLVDGTASFPSPSGRRVFGGLPEAPVARPARTNTEGADEGRREKYVSSIALTPAPLPEGEGKEVGLIDQGRRFLQRYLPVLRLIVAGSDPVTLALAQLAPLLDIELSLLRPQGPRDLPMPASNLHYDRRSLATALSELGCDEWTAVYTLTHDPDSDDAVLLHALRSPAFCVGALGSRINSERRRERLRAAGFSDAQLARLHSPAGLWIGATTPQQIALSIIGQIIESRPR